MEIFGHLFTTQDLFLVGVLVFLEGILSVDNALVLAVLAKPLPKDLRRKALTYGMAGAIGFRLLALLLITHLVQWNWVRFVGGGYLLFIAVKNLFFASSGKSEKESTSTVSVNFWKTVVLIELTDVAFAMDSILAAVALTQKLPVVFIGGVLGIIMMRFAASLFIKLLERFPRLERTAYWLVFVIGIKVVLEGFHISNLDFHSPANPAFWAFWGIMFLLICGAFVSFPLTKSSRTTK